MGDNRSWPYIHNTNLGPIFPATTILFAFVNSSTKIGKKNLYYESISHTTLQANAVFEWESKLLTLKVHQLKI